jgi:hypothetical protein
MDSHTLRTTPRSSLHISAAHANIRAFIQPLTTVGYAAFDSSPTAKMIVAAHCSGRDPIGYTDPSGTDWTVSVGVGVGVGVGGRIVNGFSAGVNGIGVQVQVTVNITAGQVTLSAGGHGIAGAGLYGGVEAQGGIGYTSGPAPAGQSQSNYATYDGGGGFGPSNGGQIQGSSDGVSVSTGVKPGVGMGIYGGVGQGSQAQWSSPTIGDIVDGIKKWCQ